MEAVFNQLDRAESNEAFSEFLSEVSAKILWDYREEKTQINDLYEVAKEKSWNANKDILWKKENYKSDFPVMIESNPLSGFEPYESLSQKKKLQISWWVHGIELSEILHGEQGALIIASQLVTCMPTVEAKLFASSQVSDEARHVEFFSRYLTEVVGEIYSPSLELKRLIKTMINDPRWDMKFIACQILIESLAMAKFQEIKQKSLNPILTFAIDYIMKDEARHVKFGSTLLKDYIQTLPHEDIQFRSNFVIDNVVHLANAENVYTLIADRLGWDKAALRHQLRKHRIKNPDINRNKFRQLALNLSTVGLLTDETNGRLHEMHVI